MIMRSYYLQRDNEQPTIQPNYLCTFNKQIISICFQQNEEEKGEIIFLWIQDDIVMVMCYVMYEGREGEDQSKIFHQD